MTERTLVSFQDAASPEFLDFLHYLQQQHESVLLPVWIDQVLSEIEDVNFLPLESVSEFENIFRKVVTKRHEQSPLQLLKNVSKIAERSDATSHLAIIFLQSFLESIKDMPAEIVSDEEDLISTILHTASTQFFSTNGKEKHEASPPSNDPEASEKELSIMEAESVTEIRSLTIYPDRRVMYKNEYHELAKDEYALLMFLLENKNQVVDFLTIFKHVVSTEEKSEAYATTIVERIWRRLTNKLITIGFPSNALTKKIKDHCVGLTLNTNLIPPKSSSKK